jgi:UPF0271 protein
MLSIDLNCDMGESTNLWPYSIEKDCELLKHITSANIACGYHAGDPDTMKLLAEAAIKNNVAIGAHPSFPDKENFGRSNMYLSRQRTYEIVLDQISLLNDIVKSVGSRLHHVKPHGALYNMSAKNSTLADAICKAVKDFDKEIILYGLYGGNLITAAEKIGLAACNEVFADRTYKEDGSLTLRSEPNALIEDADEAAQRVLQMLNKGTVICSSGKEISIKAETICIHGDGLHAIEFSKKINRLLRQNGIEIKAG